VAPHYLAYFNRAFGGPENGWRHLADSSLDWGQDLPGLGEWLRTNAGQERVFLSYFGTGEPDYYRINATRMPFFNLFQKLNPWYEPHAGLYCVGATMLQQVYSPFRGPWTPAWEKEYQEGRAKEALFREYWSNPAVRADLARLGAAAAFEETWRRYDQLRFARLCYCLRVRRPVASIGHSIFIYRLDEADVTAAINGTLNDWRGLIERTVLAKP